MMIVLAASMIALLVAAPGAKQDADPASAQSAAIQPAPKASPCIGDAYHQFDFWIGEWDVFRNDSDVQVATSRIESLYGGCAIRENWMPFRGTGGGSLSNYDSDARSWRQAWVDSSGTRVDFSGGLSGETMVLTGLWPNLLGSGRDALVRMQYSLQPDGSVRQHGEQSTDFGLSWQPSFDFIYRRRPG